MKLEKEEKINGNIIISEFMGVTYHKRMKYYCDYRMLMPVWHKFRDLIFDTPKMQLKHSEFKSRITRAILYGDIELAFTNLVDAIKKINQND